MTIFFLFYYFSINPLIQKTSLLTLTFLLAFIFFNRKKNTLYFGDSGCYVCCLLIFFFLIVDLENQNLLKAFLSSIIFPITDVFYVAIYRIYKHEDLLSRNHYHIYQVLSKKIKGRVYLLPNFIFCILNLCISFYMNLNMNFIIFLVSFNFIACFVFHFILSKLKTNI